MYGILRQMIWFDPLKENDFRHYQDSQESILKL